MFRTFYISGNKMSVSTISLDECEEITDFDEDPQSVISYKAIQTTEKRYNIKFQETTIRYINGMLSPLVDYPGCRTELHNVSVNDIIRIIPDSAAHITLGEKQGEPFTGRFNTDHNKIELIDSYICFEKLVAQGYTHIPMIVYFGSLYEGFDDIKSDTENAECGDPEI
jgi:hypothetical protein